MAYTLPAVTLPVTATKVNVPTEVMFGCAEVVKVPVIKLAPIVPELAYTLPLVTLPVTTSDVNVPTDVMFGCAAVITVPAVAAFKLATCVVETTVNGAVPLAMFEDNLEAATVPVAFKLPTLAFPVITELPVTVRTLPV